MLLLDHSGICVFGRAQGKSGLRKTREEVTGVIQVRGVGGLDQVAAVEEAGSGQILDVL